MKSWLPNKKHKSALATFIKIPVIPNVGACAIYGRLGILVSVALLGSVIIQMSSLGRATDVQHNYPVYLNCHLSHLASRTLPPSSISQTLSTDSTQPRNLVPFNVKRNQGWSRETFWISNVFKSVRRNTVVLKKRKWHSWKWKSWL